MCFQVVFEQCALNFVRSKLSADREIESVFSSCLRTECIKFVRSKLPADREIESANYYKFCFICQSVSSCQPSVSLDSFV